MEAQLKHLAQYGRVARDHISASPHCMCTTTVMSLHNIQRASAMQVAVVDARCLLARSCVELRFENVWSVTYKYTNQLCTTLHGFLSIKTAGHMHSYLQTRRPEDNLLKLNFLIETGSNLR
jgi:hypothetical protein